MAKSGHIIVLHGASSAGKSTLARALQAALPRPYWHLSIDHLRDSGVLPMARVSSGDFDWGELRGGMFDGFHASLEAYARSGNNLIVEHIFENSAMQEDVMARLSAFDVLWIGIHTPLATLETREQARGDRRLGSAAEDFARVHQGMAYDLELDGTLPAAHNAERIIAYLTA